MGVPQANEGRHRKPSQKAIRVIGAEAKGAWSREGSGNGDKCWGCGYILKVESAGSQTTERFYRKRLQKIILTMPLFCFYTTEISQEKSELQRFGSFQKKGRNYL